MGRSVGTRRQRPLAALAATIVSLVLTFPSAATATDDTTPPFGTISINGGAGYTNQAEVTLAVSATDDASGVATVSLSNDGATWTTYVYTPAVAWFLPYAPLVQGAHVVHARWTDAAGNDSAVSTATIVVDTTPPTGKIELYDLTPESVTFSLVATDANGIAGVRLSCDDGATWISRAFAAKLTVPVRDGGLGCVGYDVRWVTVEVLDRAGNALRGGGAVGLAPSFHVDMPLPAVTGSPFTIAPILPADYTIPAGDGCRWEFRWGNDRSLDQHEPDETYGSMLFDIPASAGKCAPWTFTLPWVPYRQYDVRVGLLTFEPDGVGVTIWNEVSARFGATVGTTERRITSSTLPIAQVLPSTYTPIVGSPVTYTRYLIGGASGCCTPTWTARQGNGEFPKTWHQSGGATFTITPTAPGNIVVGWDRLSGKYRLGAAYDPPVRYRDLYRPNTTAPVQRIGGGLLGSTVPVKLTWTGTDRGWGIDRYQLQRSTDGGTWRNVALPSKRATSVVQSLAGGHSYRFRVRAVDKYGNVGYWDYGATFQPRVYQESSTSLAYAGTWARVPDPDAFGGYLKQTTGAGATARMTFTGRDAAWVAERGPGHGRVRVYVDGVYVGTIDLNASADQRRRVVFARHWGASSRHTLLLRSEGTVGRPLVDLDAFVVLS